MDEAQTWHDQSEATAAHQEPRVEPTGEADIDVVLESLERLAELPLSDQVSIFEKANDGLRRALSEAGQARPQGN